MKAAPVSDDPEGKQAARAVQELKKGEFDALVVCVAGWIPSWAVFKVIEPFKDKPMLLWGLSGWRANGHFVTTADQAGTTALRAPMEAQGYNFKYLVNFKDSKPRYDEAAAYLKAASAFAALKNANVGMAGYRDMRLFGTLYNGNLLKGQLGMEIEHFDLLELQELANAVDEKEVAKVAKKITKDWKFIRAPQPGTVENSVRLALAIKAKIDERKYDAFSFCDVDGIKKLLKFAPAGAMTLLHTLCDVVSVPENDSYGLITELIVKNLEAVLEDGNNLDARAGMSQASTIAGLAFSQTGTAGSHACSYRLSIEHHIPHGEACAFTLDRWVEINAEARPELRQIYLAIGFENETAFAAWINRMKEKGELCTTLRECGVTDRAEIAAFAEHALKNNNYANNVAQIGYEGLYKLFEEKF